MKSNCTEIVRTDTLLCWDKNFYLPLSIFSIFDYFLEVPGNAEALHKNCPKKAMDE